jgi:Holliday junction resolvase RusA-like endonuclease
MVREIRVQVKGLPVAKGSAKAFYNKRLNRAMVLQSNADKQKPWVSAIVNAVEEQIGAEWVLEKGPVRIANMVFWFPRPKSHYRTGKRSDELRPDAPQKHTSKPDIDKLERCVLDALTGIVWKDDAQVWCVGEKMKCYAREAPGLSLVIECGRSL